MLDSYTLVDDLSGALPLPVYAAIESCSRTRDRSLADAACAKKSARAPARSDLSERNARDGCKTSHQRIFPEACATGGINLQDYFSVRTGRAGRIACARVSNDLGISVSPSWGAGQSPATGRGNIGRLISARNSGDGQHEAGGDAAEYPTG